MLYWVASIKEESSSHHNLPLPRDGLPSLADYFHKMSRKLLYVSGALPAEVCSAETGQQVQK